MRAGFAHLALAALAGAAVLAGLDFFQLSRGGQWPPRPFSFALQVAVLAAAGAAVAAGVAWFVVRAHGSLAARLAPASHPKLARALDVGLWSALWSALAYAPLVRLARDLAARPGLARASGSDALVAGLLPGLLLLGFSGFALLRLKAVSGRRRRGLDLALGGFVIGALAIDATFLTGYYPLYHAALGVTAFLAASYLAARWIREPSRPLARRALALVLVAALAATLGGAVFRWEPHVETALTQTTHVKRVARLLRRNSDWDGDGFSRLFGAGDPDDGNAAIHPLAVDRPGDGVDQDGDGRDAADAEHRRLRSLLVPRLVPPGGYPRVRRVVVVTVDALRADRLAGRDASGEPVMPHLAALAARGLVYERAYAPTARTVPTFRAILASSFATADSNGSFAGRLRDRGVRSALVAPALVHDLLRPLASQTEAFEARISAHSRTRGFDVSNWGVHLEEPSAPATTDSALALAARWSKGPDFLWVHYYDPHQWHDLDLGGETPAGDVERYDRVVRMIDGEIGRLVDGLEALPDGDETAILVTADHGEALGEHGLRFHAHFVWEPIARVPLILIAPGVTPGQVRAPVSLVHLGPTVIRLLGMASSPAHGPSPLPLREPAVGSPVFLTDQDQIAVVEGRWKLVFARRSRFFLLFDLEADPQERRNRAGHEPRVFRRLRTLLALHAERTGFLERL